MTYVVTGLRAVAVVDGKRVVLDRGALIPEGADEDRVKHLVSVGLVSKKADPEPVRRVRAKK